MASAELTNPRAAVVRNARRLATRAFRHDERLFLAEGAQAVGEALAGGLRGEVVVREVFVSSDAAERYAGLVTTAGDAGVSLHHCSDRVVGAISDTVTPQGLVAVCEFVDQPLTKLLDSSLRLVALLAEVRDPGNAGSVLRAADASGADAVVFSTGSVDAYNPKVVRASVGGLFHVPFAIDAAIADAVAAAHAAGLRVLAADGSGATNLDDAERDGTLAKPTAWLFGNEAWGLPPEVRELADSVIRIPIYGRAESLNLATAATLCLYASARAQQ